MKEYIIGLCLAIAVISSLGTAALITQPTTNTGTETDSVITYHSNVCVSKNGKLLSCQSNLLTNDGKDYIRELLGAGSADGAAKYIAVGNGTNTSLTDSTLDAEITTCGLARTTGTYTASGGNGNWTLSKTFDSTCVLSVVNTTALFNASSGGTLFSGTNFTSASLQSGDQLAITWNVYVN